MSSPRRPAPRTGTAAPTGGSARRLRRPLGPEVDAVGPPPTPLLDPPWAVVPVAPSGVELDHVVRWMAEPHVAAFWGQDWPHAAWSAEVARQLAGDHSRPWTVWHHGERVAYVEVYRAARDVVADAYPAGAHDLGIHIAIGDRRRTGRGLGPAVLAAVAEGLFRAEAACRAVVGDPDAAHHVARRAFAAAGFEPVAEVDLPHKRAALMARRRP
ncbi:MAG TPA: GNAT family N-acetyltransferase [Acidimicrobiales bacterium]